MQIAVPTKNPKIMEMIRIVGCILSALIYAIGVNWFIVPLNLYNGGLMGFCQLIRTVLAEYLYITFSFDIAGILFFIINIPILILAWINLEHRFVFRTLINVISTTVFLSLIPIKALIPNDVLTNCLIGGAVTGLGCGITLWSAAAGGGTDLIGFMMLRKNRNFTIGRINLAIDFVLYMLCLLLFSVQTAIYSIVYAFVCSIVMDRIHQQNINVEAIIVTRFPADELKNDIMTTLDRGLTELPAKGGYTGDEKTAFLIVISKYEMSELNAIIKKYDPNAFVTFKENTRVSGNFIKKF